jgi:prolyl 4-hydroxylase
LLLLQTGDMIGTVMAWLGDVDAGGATAFFHNQAERTLMPTRGSAAFWYDLDRKGYRDMRTYHGGCPIVKGTKWILNKWIFYFNQVQIFCYED